MSELSEAYLRRALAVERHGALGALLYEPAIDDPRGAPIIAPDDERLSVCQAKGHSQSGKPIREAGGLVTICVRCGAGMDSIGLFYRGADDYGRRLPA